jgi:hypothetical protein
MIHTLLQRQPSLLIVPALQSTALNNDDRLQLQG